MHNKVGIVIVSYNASLAVRITLASLRQAKNIVPYKLLLVDNASKEEEKRIIQKAFKKHTGEISLPWEYIPLKKNLGFSGGNNVGIRKLLNDPEITHICLLNSDVIVPDFWIDRFVGKSCEAVSGVTNKAYSEQCVPVNYSLDFSDCFDEKNETIPVTAFNTINTFAQNWYRAWQGNLVKNEVTFFCVFLTKALVKKVGLLDEKFFPGGYEDDDFCARINSIGINIYLARDIFVHHFGSASFGQLQQQYFNRQAAKNKKYLEKKHNFLWKRRPEKPVTSYEQDITYALNGSGDRPLQLQYNKLYIETLTSLIHHHDNEFISLQNHIMHCGHIIPPDVQPLINSAAQYGKISEEWDKALLDINEGLHLKKSSSSLIELISQKLRNIANAIYDKAEANMAIVKFLINIGVFSAGSEILKESLLKKIKWLIIKGVPFLWKLKGIVFFAGYPYIEREKDGYFQRIRFIDNLFPDRWRIYIDHGVLPGKNIWYNRPAPRILVLHINNHTHKWFMRLIVSLCVLKCRVIYFHSVLRMEDSGFGRFMHWPGITKIIDIHGVVPEEFRFHNDFYSASLFDAHERLAIKKANYMLVVSKTMQDYFEHKYRKALDNIQIIVLPIFPDIQPVRLNKPYINGQPMVVYAGGTHKWQQVPKMIEAIALTREFCIHNFFCPKPEEVLAMMPEELRQDPRIIINSKSFTELLEIYKEFNYGFILREDIVVNHVSCPTKLVEYIAMGIVPIVDCENIGDFKMLGMQYVKLKDFVNGKIPDERVRHGMAEKNFAVYMKLKEMNYAGKVVLKNLLMRKKNYGIRKIVQTGKRVAVSFFPDGTKHGQFVRKIWWNTKPFLLNNNKVFVNDLTAPVKMLHTLSPCNILMQVNDFAVGGLENMVLDLSEIFINAGLQVNFLVLGNPGACLERVREKGIPICITPYNENTYRIILNDSSPDIVIAHYSIHGAAICKEFNIPFIQVVHNTYMWFTDEQVHQFSRTIPHTTAFIAVSEFVKAYSLARLNLPKEKCLVIPNGINVSHFKKNYEAERNNIRAQYGLSESDFVFLSVGSINHQKNHICTVRAFHMVIKECPNARLVILGKIYEPALWSEIYQYIILHQLENFIIYAGESNDSRSYYAMADAFVHSAFFEGGQLSLLEAITTNLPIITTNVGFANHFKNINGISLIEPVVHITEYKGPITGLKSTYECEAKMAVKMILVYTKYKRPDIPQEIIDMFDVSHTYQHYINLINHIKRYGDISSYLINPNWPDMILENKELIFSRVDFTSYQTILPSLPDCDVLLQVNNFLVGGLENVVLDQMHIFKEKGLKVGILILGEVGLAAKKAYLKGFPICITPYNADTYRMLLIMSCTKVVISHYSFNGADICNELNVAFVQVIQNTYMWFSKEQVERFAQAAKHTKAFVAVSDEAKRYSVQRLRIPKEKCLIIPNSIELESFKNINYQKERINLRKRYGLSDEHFVFLSVGSINHQKNHICTVRAFHTALQSCPDIKLVILGKLYEPQLWTEIMDYICTHKLEDYIIYAGESINPPAYYSMADAFVHSAFFEGGPLSLLEALAMNLPVICTEVGFAKHFKNTKGINIVAPPIDIITYNGTILEMRSTAECEANIAKNMIQTYKNPVRPDIPQDFINMFDASHTYQHYVSIIRHFIKGGSLSDYASPENWPDVILQRNANNVSGLLYS